MRRSASAAWLAAALLAVLYATLSPAPENHPALLEHVRWLPELGDILRNLLLFIPLGAAWSARGASLKTAAAGSFALSLLLEFAQLAVPGRYGSPWDVLANTAGGGVGAWVARDAWRWLAPSRKAANRLVLAAGALAAAWIAFAGWLSLPSPPPGAYFAHWTPAMSNWFPIDARLRSAALDGAPLAHGALPHPDRLRQALSGDFALEIEAVAGRPTQGLAALLWLTNESGREILLAGVERTDLILRWPVRSAALALDSTPLRVPGLFAGQEPGKPFRLLLTRRGPETCVALDASRRCGLGHTLGDGWRLLAPELRLSPRARGALAAAWLAALFLPIGYWFAPGVVPLAALTAASAAMLLTPRLASVLPTPPLQLAAAILGLALGLGLQRLRRVRAANPPE